MHIDLIKLWLLIICIVIQWFASRIKLFSCKFASFNFDEELGTSSVNFWFGIRVLETVQVLSFDSVSNLQFELCNWLRI